MGLGSLIPLLIFEVSIWLVHLLPKSSCFLWKVWRRDRNSSAPRVCISSATEEENDPIPNKAVKEDWSRPWSGLSKCWSVRRPSPLHLCFRGQSKVKVNRKSSSTLKQTPLQLRWSPTPLLTSYISMTASKNVQINSSSVHKNMPARASARTRGAALHKYKQ